MGAGPAGLTAAITLPRSAPSSSAALPYLVQPEAAVGMELRHYLEPGGLGQ